MKAGAIKVIVNWMQCLLSRKKTGENNKKQLFLAFFVSYQIRNSLKTNRETAGLKVQAKKNKNQIDCFVRYFCKSRKLWVNGLFNTIYIKIITGFSKCVVPVRKIHHCIFNRVKKSQIPFIQLTWWKSAAQILKDWFKCICSIFVQCIPIISCIYLFK